MNDETALSCDTTTTANGAVGGQFVAATVGSQQRLNETVATSGDSSKFRDVNFNKSVNVGADRSPNSSITNDSIATAQPEVVCSRCPAIGRKSVVQKQQQLISIEMAAASNSTSDCKPGTSKSSGNSASGSPPERRHRKDSNEDHAPSESALRRPRKSLPFLPRTSQYERHPLLQTKSTATGLSEFELLMLEKDALVRRKSFGESSRQQGDGHRPCEPQASVDGSNSSTAVRRRPTLVPRGAHYEPHPLFVRSESGVCELEAYLSEMSTTTTNDKSKVTQQQNSVGSKISSPTQPSSSTSASTAPSSFTPSAASAPRKLEPRTSQWERHALLEFKDESGMSELERLLKEKDLEYRSREKKSISNRDGCCPTSVTDSGNGQPCAAVSDATGNSEAIASNESVPIDDSADGRCSATVSSAAQKRVRFVAQRQKTEPEDVGMHAIDDVTVTPGVGHATDEDGADAKHSGRNSKSKSQLGRDSRAQMASTGAGGQRKSCCIS